MGFQKIIYKNVKKKKKKESQQIYLYIWVTDILKFYEVLFCTYCTLSTYLKKQSLCLFSSIYA